MYHERRKSIQLTRTSVIIPVKVFVVVAPSFAIMVAPLHATTRVNATLAGVLSGRTLLYAVSVYFGANSDSVRQLRISVTASSPCRLNVVLELRMKSLSDTTKDGICRDHVGVSVAAICTLPLILIVTKIWSQKTSL
jgi:hypothetical protein